MLFVKKALKWSLISGVLIFTLLAAVQAMEHSQGDAVVGKPLYEQHCLACHGLVGKGDGVAAASLPSRPANLQQHLAVYSLFDIDYFTIPRLVLGGKVDEGMPAFKDQLVRADVQNIYAYLRSLK